MIYHPKHEPKTQPTMSTEARPRASREGVYSKENRKGALVSAPHEDRERLTPPGAGYELYRHKATEALETKGWHGLYWARRTESGDYEIRSVPTSLGEPFAPGGIIPRDGFERLYERVDP